MEQVIVKNQSEEYMVNVIRSKRKTMALQVGLDGTVVARVPNRVAKKEVLRFLDSHAAWIAAAKKKMARRQQEKQAYGIRTSRYARHNPVSRTNHLIFFCKCTHTIQHFPVFLS